MPTQVSSTSTASSAPLAVLTAAMAELDPQASPDSALGDEEAVPRHRSMSECDRILKRRDKYGRSLSTASNQSISESDDHNGSTQSVFTDADDSEMSYEECSALSRSLTHGDSLLSFLTHKKSVRFAEKLAHERRYKVGTSILGQKKKNEKRSKARRERTLSGDSNTSDKPSDDEPISSSLPKWYKSTKPLEYPITPIKEYPIAEQIADQTSAMNRLAAMMPKTRQSRTITTSDTEGDDDIYVPIKTRETSNEIAADPPIVETAKTRNKKRRNKRKAAKTGKVADAAPTAPVPIKPKNGFVPTGGGSEENGWMTVKSGRRRESRQSGESDVDGRDLDDNDVLW